MVPIRRAYVVRPVPAPHVNPRCERFRGCADVHPTRLSRRPSPHEISLRRRAGPRALQEECFTRRGLNAPSWLGEWPCPVPESGPSHRLVDAVGLRLWDEPVTRAPDQQTADPFVRMVGSKTIQDA